jgi:hypothetical protein
MGKPKLKCLLSHHHLDLLEKGFQVFKKSNLGYWIQRHYWYHPGEERIYWNSKKIFRSNHSFYPFQIRSMEKMYDTESQIHLSIYLPKNKYENVEVIYKTIEWRFESEEERNEIFTAIQQLRSQYQSEYSIFPKIK